MSPRAPIDLAPPVEKAFLVAVDAGDDAGWTAEDSLNELAALAATAGADVVGAEWQNRRHVDPNWYVGKGKAEDLLQAKSETGYDILVADDELSQELMIDGAMTLALGPTRKIDTPNSRTLAINTSSHAAAITGRSSGIVTVRS